MTTARDTIVDALDLESFVLCGVAQICNLPYRRIVFGTASRRMGPHGLPTISGLQIRDTAESNSALRRHGGAARGARALARFNVRKHEARKTPSPLEFCTLKRRERRAPFGEPSGASSSLTPALSPRRGRNVPRVSAKPRWSSAPRLTNFTSDGQRLFPLPSAFAVLRRDEAGEGQGEGEASEFLQPHIFPNRKPIRP